MFCEHTYALLIRFFFSLLSIQPRASHVPYKHLAPEFYTQLQVVFFFGGKGEFGKLDVKSLDTSLIVCYLFFTS